MWTPWLAFPSHFALTQWLVTHHDLISSSIGFKLGTGWQSRSSQASPSQSVARCQWQWPFKLVTVWRARDSDSGGSSGYCGPSQWPGPGPVPARAPAGHTPSPVRGSVTVTISHRRCQTVWRDSGGPGLLSTRLLQPAVTVTVWAPAGRGPGPGPAGGALRVRCGIQVAGRHGKARNGIQVQWFLGSGCTSTVCRQCSPAVDHHHRSLVVWFGCYAAV